MLSPRRLLLHLPLALALGLAPSLAALPAQAAPTLVTSGNHNLVVRAADGAATLAGSTRLGAEPVLRIPDAQAGTLPDTPAHAPLGRPGERAWLSGATGATATAPALGFTIVPREPTAPDVTVRLDDVIAPVGGAYQAYRIGVGQTPGHAAAPVATPENGFGLTLLGTGTAGDGSAQPRTASLTATAAAQTALSYVQHRFTAPGLYCVTYSEELTPPGGTAALRTNGFTVRFAVGDAVAADAPCGTGGSTGGDPDPDPGDGGPGDPGPGNGGPGTPDPSIFVMRTGHADVIAPRLLGAERRLDLSAKVDGQGFLPYRNLVVVHPDLLTSTVPTDGQWAFLGAPGATFWNSPQASGSVPGGTTAFPWIGSSTEDDALVANGSRTDMTIEQVVGATGGAAPGDLAVWTSPATGPRVLVSTRAGAVTGGVPAMLSSTAARNHSHYNWSFTAPGVYCLAVSVQTEVGGQLQRVRDWLTMVVGGDGAGVTPCARTLAAPGEPQPAPVTLPTTPGPHIADDSGALSLHPTTGGALTIADWNPLTARPARYTPVDDTIVHLRRAQVDQGSSELAINAFGRLRADLLGRPASDGGELLRIERVRGPRGPVQIAGIRSDAADPSLRLRPREGASALTPSAFSAPGRYCIDLTWTSDSGVSRASVLTVVVDGPTSLAEPTTSIWRGAERGALDRTCAAGAAPIDPTDDDGGDGGDGGDSGNGGDPVFDAPNGWVNQAGATIIDDGHVDLSARLIGGRLVTDIKDSATRPTVVRRGFTDTVLHVGTAARQVLPDVPELSFLGPVGEPLWVAPETQADGVIWPGWSSEEIAPGAVPGGVTWRLLDVEGPGEVALYTGSPGGFGRVEPHFTTRDGISAADALVIAEATHVHGTWAFSAEGTYCLRTERTGRAASGAALREEFTVMFAVGRTDLRQLDPTDCFGSDGRPTTDDTTAIPAEQLTDAAAGGVQLIDPRDGALPGQQVTLQVGREHAGRWVSVWVRSAPRWLGWTQVGASGAARVRLPVDLAIGDHRLVVENTAGELIGWDAVSVIAASSGPGASPAPPAAAGPVTVVPPTGAVAQQCVPRRATVISSGHIDYATQIVGGRLESMIGTDAGGTKAYRDPADVVLWLKPSSAVRVPASLGRIGTPGSTVWQVPQTQAADLIWLGWNTETIAGQVRGPVRWSLESVNGPGRVTVYTAGSFGGVQQVVFDGPGSTSVPAGVHAHANWAFSAQGIYRLTFRQEATLADGRSVSDRAVLTMAVGDVDPASAASGSSCGGVSSATARGSATLPEVAQAAELAQAQLAEVDRGLVPDRLAQQVEEAVGPGAVPILLAVLGGLLVLAAGGATWWWRRSPAGS